MLTDQGFVLKIGLHVTGHYALALSYNIANGLTCGVVLAQTQLPDPTKLVDLLIDMKELCCHPMLVPVILVDLVMRTTMEKTDYYDKQLTLTEETTGQHSYRRRYIGEPPEIDFVTITRKLNSTSSHFGVCEMRFNSALLANRTTIEYMDWLQRAIPRDMANQLRRDSRKLQEHVDYLSSLSNNFLLRVQYNQKRVQTQLAVVGSSAEYSTAIC